MPTHEEEDRFWRDWRPLTLEQQRQFRAAVQEMVEDLKAKRPFRAGLRVKSYHSRKGVFAMTWAGNGRELFTFGDPIQSDEPHIVWLRIGAHDIY